MSNSLVPDQARHFVWPDLCPNCLKRLSAGDTSRQRVKSEWQDYDIRKEILSCAIFAVCYVPSTAKVI